MAMDVERARDLVDEIAGRGFESRDRAERALRAALAALADRLTHDGAIRLARVLPARLRDGLTPALGATPPDAAALVERVRRREAVSPGRAREELQIVCAVLGERLSDDDRREVTRGLPAEIVADFERPDGEAAVALAPRPRPRSPAGRTLATGRPGSRRPLSEATTDGAHAESVARAIEPHRETKLSSAEGLTQERAHETLATGRPGPERPLGEADDGAIRSRKPSR